MDDNLPSETRWLRNEVWDSYYVLGLSNTTTSAQQSDSYSGEVGVIYYFSVWKRNPAGTETLLIDWTYLFERTTDGEGIQSAVKSISEQSLEATDRVIVKIKIVIGTTEKIITFITEQLGASKLDAVNWTFYLYTKRYYDGKSTFGWLYWGDATYYGKIENFTWTPVPVLIIERGDGLVWIRA